MLVCEIGIIFVLYLSWDDLGWMLGVWVAGKWDVDLKEAE